MAAASEEAGGPKHRPSSAFQRFGLRIALGMCILWAIIDCVLFERASWFPHGIGTDSFDLLLCLLLAGLGVHVLVRSGTPAGHKAVPLQRDRTSIPTGEAICGATSRSTLLARLNQNLEQAVRHGKADLAAKTIANFEATTGQQPEPLSYNLVMNAYAKKGDVRSAEQWLARMQSKGVQITTCSCNTLLDACARANDLQGCERWLGYMCDHGAKPNVISYATVIYAHARQGGKAKAEALFRKMLEAKIMPDAMCYNSLIHACSVCGQAERAETWLQEMQTSGLSPNVTTFTAVIDACAKAGDVPKAEKWLGTMMQQGVEANVVTYSALIDACAKAGNLKRAEFWLNEMPSRGVQPNAHSYSAVINACAKSGSVDAAEQWLDRSEEAGITNDVVVYSSVIDACGKANQPDRALAAFDRMVVQGIRPHVVAYSALARPFAYQGRWVEVERIAEDMKNDGVRANEYFVYAHLLAYAMARPRQGSKAEQCFRGAVEMGIQPNEHITAALSRAVGRVRTTELVQQLFGSAVASKACGRRGSSTTSLADKRIPR